MTSNAWITMLAYEGRTRHAAACRRDKGIARRMAAVRSNVVADLRCAIALDLEAFLRAEGERSGSRFTCQIGNLVEGFVVSRTDCIGTRSVAVDLNARTLNCRYDMSVDRSTDGAHDRWGFVIDIGGASSALTLWDEGSARTFPSVDSLSAFLLSPLLKNAYWSAFAWGPTTTRLEDQRSDAVT